MYDSFVNNMDEQLQSLETYSSCLEFMVNPQEKKKDGEPELVGC